jgi:hypothetical protein
MKEIIKISILVIILGCNQSKINTPIKKEIVTVIDTIIEEQVDSNDYLESVKQTEGKFSLKDLSNEFCLIFGTGKYESNNFWNDKNIDSLKGFIIDPTYEEFSNLRELRAQRIHIYPKNDSLPICRFKNSLLIPFTSNEERSHLTIWKIMSGDSVKFDRILQPSIERKYSNIVSIEMIELKGENYLTLYMKGGEGGGNWDEQIIAKYDKDKFEIIDSEGVGYCHDCGDWAKIKLKVNSDGFEMTEIRDSMRLIDDSWVREWRKVIKMKTIKI